MVALELVHSDALTAMLVYPALIGLWVVIFLAFAEAERLLKSRRHDKERGRSNER